MVELRPDFSNFQRRLIFDRLLFGLDPVELYM
jgi:hypothetical protein